MILTNESCILTHLLLIPDRIPLSIAMLLGRSSMLSNPNQRIAALRCLAAALQIPAAQASETAIDAMISISSLVLSASDQELAGRAAPDP